MHKKNDDLENEEESKPINESTSEKKKNKNTKVEEPDPTEEENIFGREQLLVVCQFCGCRIYTSIEHQTSWTGIFLSLVLFIVFKFYSIFLIALLIPLTQSTIHTCPNCLNQVGKRTFYDILSLTDKVFAFQISSIGIIITKKQLLSAFVFSFFALFFYIFFSSFTLQRTILEDTWDDFKALCQQQGSNPQGCLNKYYYQRVSWKGYAIRVDFDDRFFSHIRASILIKMDYNKNITNEDPDLVLYFTDQTYESFRTDILNTTRGDLVQFNATILSLAASANIQKPALNVFGYKQLFEKVYIDPHLNPRGRYGTNNDKMLQGGEEIYAELPGLVVEDINDDDDDNK